MAYTNSTDYSHERFGSPEKFRRNCVGSGHSSVTGTGAGILSFLKQPGDMVTKGEVIAKVAGTEPLEGKGAYLLTF